MSLTVVSFGAAVRIGGELDVDGLRGFVLLATTPNPAQLSPAAARRVARSLTMFAERARVTKSKPARGAYASGRRVKRLGTANNSKALDVDDATVAALMRELEATGDEDAIAAARHTMQWRSPQNQPGAAPPKTRPARKRGKR